MMGISFNSKKTASDIGRSVNMEYHVVKRFIVAVLAASWTLSAAAVNTPPVVAITAPTAESSFVAPATITLRAAAEDSDGAIAAVSFYDGTTLIGTATTSPYTYQWTGAVVGSYSITAKATDDMGAETISAP